jgi:hypothetical protein
MILGIDPGTKRGWSNAGWAIVGVDGMLVSAGIGKPAAYAVKISVVEVPRHYPGSKVPPNDLILLALHAGLLIGHPTGPRFGVFPRTWKGTIRKEIMTRRIENCLTESEKQKVLHLNHNVLDAIGLAKWAASRKTKRWWDLDLGWST